MIFFTSPVGGGPPEVRFAHPVRLPPAPIHKADDVAQPASCCVSNI